MTAEEIDEFLAEELTCRVATVSPDGPHVAPLWFAWHDGALWLNSLVRSQRWADIQRDPRVAITIDAGLRYDELRGVQIRGIAEPVGEIPRRGDAEPLLDQPERLFAARYMGGQFYHDGRHAWLKVTPLQITSWDFRKSQQAAATAEVLADPAAGQTSG